MNAILFLRAVATVIPRGIPIGPSCQGGGQRVFFVRAALYSCLFTLDTSLAYSQGHDEMLISAAAQPTFVQGNSKTSKEPLLTVSVPYTDAQGSGDLNVVIVGQRWNDSTAEAGPPTDTQGNPYQLAAGPTVLEASISLTQSVYYAKNISPAGAGTNVVTMKFSTAAAYPDIRILEYSGIDRVVPVETTATGMGNGTLPHSGAAVTKNATDLLLGAALALTPAATNPGNGFTKRMAAPSGSIAQDGIATVAGSYSASAFLGTPGPWIMHLIAFRAANTTPPTPVSALDAPRSP